MRYECFMKLVEIVRPSLIVDEVMARVRAGNQPVLPEISLHCLLRWLAGGLYLDIRISVGISIRTFYRNMKKCISAILQSTELAYCFPTDLEAASREFSNISSHGAIYGCVACVDGYLLRIQVPSSKETPNVKSFYSGHYQTYGMNVQAACDHRSRFVSVCIAVPGSSSDLLAYEKTNLSQQVNNLPIGKFIVGDNAYISTERLLTPFSGNDRAEPQHDTYNFYLSQVRMRIEMAFGLMTQKWSILKKPLRTKLRMSGELFMCITRIHNFCITNCDYDVSEMLGEPTEQYAYFPSDITVQDVRGTSIMRDRVVQSLLNRGLERPAHNRLRNT
jgi:DDE superfamily endonuclease